MIGDPFRVQWLSCGDECLGREETLDPSDPSTSILASVCAEKGAGLRDYGRPCVVP